MKSLRILLLLLTLSLAVSARAQISQTADYFGKIGNADYRVTLSSGGTQVRFQYYTNGREVGIGNVGTNGTASFVTDRGRGVTLRVQGNAVTGTFLNQNFSATKESSTGPLATVSGAYAGTFNEATTGSVDSFSLVTLELFPSGKAELFISDSLNYNIAERFSVGTVTTSGAASFSVSSASAALNGDTLRMTFRPDGDLGFGQMTSSLFPRNSLFCFLARTKGATLVNVSTRSLLTPAQPVTAGFVVTGGNKTLLIRAVGPTLAAFGVAGANADTKLSLFSGPAMIGTNDNWGENANAADIPAAAAQVGAFALGAGSKDAALLVQLQPGAYTVTATSVGAAAGDALIEVYEVSR